MESQKRGSVWVMILVVFAIIGIVIYYLSNNESKQNEKVSESKNLIMETQENMTTPEQARQTSMDAETDLLLQIESLDTDFSDMNAEDLDM
jgi:septal ring-binding cell division protein DamX